MEIHLPGARHPFKHVHSGSSADRLSNRDANRAVEDILPSVYADTPNRWSSMIPVVECALNDSVHASTGYTLFYLYGPTHLRVRLTLQRGGFGLGGGEVADRLADVSPASVQR